MNRVVSLVNSFLTNGEPLNFRKCANFYTDFKGELIYVDNDYFEYKVYYDDENKCLYVDAKGVHYVSKKTYLDGLWFRGDKNKLYILRTVIIDDSNKVYYYLTHFSNSKLYHQETELNFDSIISVDSTYDIMDVYLANKYLCFMFKHKYNIYVAIWDNYNHTVINHSKFIKKIPLIRDVEDIYIK